ncbi:MAG: NTPase KAP [Verrucomicrobiaceae bacterium]|nr:NTPase KAP [Verrucomicrobiaceae bacterium]
MFLSDNETNTDLLYYEPIAGSIIALVRSDQQKPISIGIHGDWGAGKSSLLAMIEDGMKDDENVVCLRFNGWLFQGFDDAKTVFLESIVEGLEKARPFTGDAKAGVSKVFKSLYRRLDWFKIAKKTGGLLASVGTGLPIGSAIEFLADRVKGAITSPGTEITAEGVTAALDSAGECLKDEKSGASLPKQMHEFREELEHLIVSAKITRLVVLIDDLDRCLPETAIETLEAAKLFLSLPRVAIVIAADEGMIEYAVKRHFPDLPLGAGGVSYARNYLEKLIQVPFRIPAMGLAETQLYLALLLVEAAQSEKKGTEEGYFESMREMAREVLRKPWEREPFDSKELRRKFGATIPPMVQEAIDLSQQIAVSLTDGTKGNPRQIKRFLNTFLLRLEVAQIRGFGSEIVRPVLAKIMLAERFWPAGGYDQLVQAVVACRDGKSDAIKQLESEPEKGDADGKEAWVTLPAVKQWAVTGPKLATIDLRPYMMLTRDRRLQFSVTGGDLDELVASLASTTSPAVVGQFTEKLRQLKADDAQAVFDAIASKIRASDDYKTMPKGVLALGILAKLHVPLQRMLVAFARDLPVDRIGPWVAGESRV